MLTRKDFQATADILREQIRETQVIVDGVVIPGLVKTEFAQKHETLRDLMYEFANWFQAENPKFDRDKFIRACFTD